MKLSDRARYFAGDVIRLVDEFIEDQWFDLTHHVRTSFNVSLPHLGLEPGELRDSEMYQPARPAHIRRAFDEMGVADVRGYSFIDLGSGKGRSLFVAAERPFRQVIGVERSERLHVQAVANTRRFWPRREGCRNVTAVLADATEYVFPAGDLVLYLFNPFGAATTQTVLNRLQASLAAEPRHVVILMLWPRCQDQVAALPGVRLLRQTREYWIFDLGRRVA